MKTSRWKHEDTYLSKVYIEEEEEKIIPGNLLKKNTRKWEKHWNSQGILLGRKSGEPCDWTSKCYFISAKLGWLLYPIDPFVCASVCLHCDFYNTCLLLLRKKLNLYLGVDFFRINEFLRFIIENRKLRGTWLYLLIWCILIDYITYISSFLSNSVMMPFTWKLLNQINQKKVSNWPCLFNLISSARERSRTCLYGRRCFQGDFLFQKHSDASGISKARLGRPMVLEKRDLYYKVWVMTRSVSYLSFKLTKP